LAIAESLKRADLVVDTTAHLGTALQLAGQPDQASTFYARGLALARENGNQQSEAVLLNNIGLLEKQAGRVKEADASFRAALAINKVLDNRSAQAANLANLGLIAEAAGNLDEAYGNFRAALELDKAVENRSAIAADLSGLARVAAAQNQTGEALAYAQRSYWSYRALGDMPRAKTELNRALALARAQGEKEAILQLETELKLWPAPDSSDKPRQDKR
jgi:tetratricopeptide (TPR) repeat protein